MCMHSFASRFMAFLILPLHSCNPSSMPSLSILQKQLSAAIFVLSCFSNYLAPFAYTCTHCKAEGDIEFKSNCSSQQKLHPTWWTLSRPKGVLGQMCTLVEKTIPINLSLVVQIHVKPKKHFDAFEKKIHHVCIQCDRGCTLDVHAFLCEPIYGVFDVAAA